MLISVVWKGSTEENCSEQVHVNFKTEATQRKEKKEVKERFMWSALEFSHNSISVV